MLDDSNNTEEEIENISNAIQRFRRSENILEVQRADVVGKLYIYQIERKGKEFI